MAKKLGLINSDYINENKDWLDYNVSKAYGTPTVHHDVGHFTNDGWQQGYLARTRNLAKTYGGEFGTKDYYNFLRQVRHPDKYGYDLIADASYTRHRKDGDQTFYLSDDTKRNILSNRYGTWIANWQKEYSDGNQHSTGLNSNGTRKRNHTHKSGVLCFGEGCGEQATDDSTITKKGGVGRWVLKHRSLGGFDWPGGNNGEGGTPVDEDDSKYTISITLDQPHYGASDGEPEEHPLHKETDPIVGIEEQYEDAVDPTQFSVPKTKEEIDYLLRFINENGDTRNGWIPIAHNLGISNEVVQGIRRLYPLYYPPRLKPVTTVDYKPGKPGVKVRTAPVKYQEQSSQPPVEGTDKNGKYGMDYYNEGNPDTVPTYKVTVTDSKSGLTYTVSVPEDVAKGIQQGTFIGEPPTKEQLLGVDFHRNGGMINYLYLFK